MPQSLGACWRGRIAGLETELVHLEDEIGGERVKGYAPSDDRLDLYNRLASAQRRHLEAIGLDRTARELVPTLSTYIREIESQKAKAQAEDAECRRMTAFNIIDACHDPEVFGPAFRDETTWQAWFAFLAALFGLTMDAEQRRIFTECTQRSDRPSTAATEAWLVCGRRAGKSFILALVAVFLACCRDWLPYLGIGERGTIMVLAADRRQARIIMRYIKGLLRLVPMLARMIKVERQEAVDLSNRITVEVHTCSFRQRAATPVVAALLDELAFWRGEDSSNPDDEIINAIKPAMATIPSAMMLCASSPYARRGALWEAYHRYFGQAGGPLIWQASTRTMNPTVPQSFIDAEYDKDAISAEAEYGAQFRTDIESLYQREAVEAAVDWSVLEREPVTSKSYVGFS